jgi:hypothetical protein
MDVRGGGGAPLLSGAGGGSGPGTYAGQIAAAYSNPGIQPVGGMGISGADAPMAGGLNAGLGALVGGAGMVQSGYDWSQAPLF